MPSLWRRLFRRSWEERDMADEIAGHIAGRAAHLESAGVPRDEAWRQANLEFGSIEKYKEQCRESRGFRPFDELSQDLRYAFRMLRRSPSAAFVAIASVAIGIGANTTVYSLVNALLLRTLPVREPSRLVLLEESSSRGRGASSYLIYGKLREALKGRVLTDLAALQMPGKVTVVPPGGEPFEAARENVSENYFKVLGIGLIAGANFTEADGKIGAAPVAILSQHLWQARFQGLPDILGKNIVVDDRAVRVAGIAPPSYRGLVAEITTDLWVNLASTSQPQQLTQRGYNFLQLFGRLQPGATMGQADAAARTIYDSDQDEEIRGLPAERRAFERRHLTAIAADTGISGLRQLFGLPLRIVMGVVAILLLISCANVANLLLARMAARRREVATRISLGAGAGRLIRQFLTESVLLAFLGGACGVALAWWGARALAGLLPDRGIPITLDVHPDVNVLLFTTVISVLSALIFGLTPALRILRSDISTGLKTAAGADLAIHTHLRPGKFLVIAQVALSVVLLFAASLFLRTLANLRNVKAGFRPDHVVTFSLGMPRGYAGASLSALTQKIVEKIRTMPRVAAASASSGMMGGGGIDLDIQIAGKPAIVYGKQRPMVVVTGPGFLSVIRAPLLAGRDFDDRDQNGAPLVAMINEAFARAHFSNENPIGQKLTTRVLDGKTATLVGIVRDVRHWGLRDPAAPAVYFPTSQMTRLWMPQYILRTDSSIAELTPMIRQAAAAVDGRLRLATIQTLDKEVDGYLGRERLLASLSSMFGFIALVLASVGVYGVTAYGVARRMSEIGLRMALGANRPQVWKMLIQDAVIAPIAGIAVGVPIAFFASRLTGSLLFGVKAGDPVSLGISGGLLLATAIAAAAIPVRRALRTDPLAVLRHE